ncbi:MAG: hypothetical protein ACREF3_10745 [Acetobacteraceae bacterium]
MGLGGFASCRRADAVVAAFAFVAGADFLADFAIDLATAFTPGFAAARAAERRLAAAAPALAFIVDTSFLVPRLFRPPQRSHVSLSDRPASHGDRHWSGECFFARPSWGLTTLPSPPHANIARRRAIVMGGDGDKRSLQGG